MQSNIAPQKGKPVHSPLEDAADFLTRLLEQGVLPAAERAEAGDLLAALGDPRFNAERWFLPEDPTLGFVAIPQGAFPMGEDGRKTNTGAYYLARYPVTVAQFAAFVEDSGFEPGNRDCLGDPGNRPVAWINWFEAMAYCDWLGAKLAQLAREVMAGSSAPGTDHALWQGLADGSLRVSLPSEAEWEKAARGQSGYPYPWGKEITANHANYRDTGLERTCAVGSFPLGASPYGLFDMAGNVWNWLRTQWGTSLEEPAFPLPYDPDDGRDLVDGPADYLRGMRGGSFLVEDARARSTYRDAVAPADRDDGDGFRIVITAAPLTAAELEKTK